MKPPVMALVLVSVSASLLVGLAVGRVVKQMEVDESVDYPCVLTLRGSVQHFRENKGDWPKSVDEAIEFDRGNSDIAFAEGCVRKGIRADLIEVDINRVIMVFSQTAQGRSSRRADGYRYGVGPNGEKRWEKW